ncbi:MAG: cysteine rich repeat-containing protein [Hyphomicrobiaceae bacterium]|nr:cysteine rich repeat-containing protein [Hyphomicrobiaceae bacterium]
MTIKRTLISAAGVVLLSGAALAQSGPVATACKADIAKLCAGKGHGQGQTRACLEANKSKVSAACKTALDSTGGGQGRGRNRQ